MNDPIFSQMKEQLIPSPAARAALEEGLSRPVRRPVHRCWVLAACLLLAAALLARLAAGAPETYGAASAELSEKADKALQRQKEQRRHEKKLQKGEKKPWAAPPARKESPPEPAGKRTLPRGRLTVKKKTP